MEQHIVDAIAAELVGQRDALTQRNINLAIELAEAKQKIAQLQRQLDAPAEAPSVPAKGNGQGHAIPHDAPAGDP